MKRTIIILITAGALIVSGCVTRVPYQGKDFSQLHPLIIEVKDTPRKVQYASFTQMMGRYSLLIIAAYAGGIYAGLAACIPVSFIPFRKIELPKDYNYTKTLALAFQEQAQQKLPGWPTEYTFLETNRTQSTNGYLLSFSAKMPSLLYTLKLTTVHLFTYGHVELFDPEGNVLWRENASHSPGILKRDHMVRSFKKNHAKLLVEEMDFSAVSTASNLIEHLQNCLISE